MPTKSSRKVAKKVEKESSGLGDRPRKIKCSRNMSEDLLLSEERNLTIKRTNMNWKVVSTRENGLSGNRIKIEILSVKMNMARENIPNELHKVGVLQKNRKPALKAAKQPVECCNGVEKIRVEGSEIFMDIEFNDCLMKPNDVKDGFEANY